MAAELAEQLAAQYEQDGSNEPVEVAVTNGSTRAEA